MNDVRVLHEHNGSLGWVVRADTFLHKQKIMCEGSYETCMSYACRPLKNPLTGCILLTIEDRLYKFYRNGIVRRVTA